MEMNIGIFMFYGGIIGTIFFLILLVIMIATIRKKRKKLIEKIQNEL